MVKKLPKARKAIKALIKRFQPVRQNLSLRTKRILVLVDKSPMRAFFGLLGVILILIIIGHFLRKPPVAPAASEAVVKPVTLYSIGALPKAEFSGSVEKSGALTVLAQSPGFVQKIYGSPGKTVKKGQQLLWLSTNAQGGTLPSVQRQLAQKNADLVESTFDSQKELIAKRREIAEKNDTQADELRDITEDSLDATRDVIGLNEEILRTLDKQLAQYTATNSGGINEAFILQTQQVKAGVLSGLSGLKTALATGEFQSSEDKSPAQLSNLSAEMTLKQLEIEEKSLELSKEIATLNLKVAQIGESLMYPISPCAGVVERVHVYPGHSVSPGTPLLRIVCTSNIARVFVAVSGDTAARISRLEKSIINLGNGETVALFPTYISTEPTEGRLHSVLFEIPDTLSQNISDRAFLPVSIPIDGAQTSAAIPFIPLDSVYQTQHDAYVFVAVSSGEELTATVKTVKLGAVQGSFVEVKEGLSAADQVILDRSVIAGDKVTQQ